MVLVISGHGWLAMKVSRPISEPGSTPIPKCPVGRHANPGIGREPRSVRAFGVERPTSRAAQVLSGQPTEATSDAGE